MPRFIGPWRERRWWRLNMPFFTLGHSSPAALFAAKSRIETNSANVDILVIGDSTGNDAEDWVSVFTTWLASRYPTHTVNYLLWDDAANQYAAASVRGTGTGTYSINVWNACIAGKSTPYLTGAKKASAISALSPHAIIWNHGQNVIGASGGRADWLYISEFMQGFDEVRLVHPSVPTDIIIQNPRRDTTLMDQAVSLLRQIGPHYGGLIDVHSAFIARNKDTSLYLDDIHPNAAGSIVWRDAVISAWEAANALPAQNAAHTSATQTNLLTNGDFANWTGATPAGWSVVSATTTKDTGIVEGASPYSARIEGTTAGAGLRQDITATALRNKTVFLAVRMLVPSGQATTSGRIYLQDIDGVQNITYATSNATYGVGGFCWQFIGPIAVRNTTTVLRTHLYVNSAANTADKIYIDRAVLVESPVPRDMA